MVVWWFFYSDKYIIILCHGNAARLHLSTFIEKALRMVFALLVVCGDQPYVSHGDQYGRLARFLTPIVFPAFRDTEALSITRSYPRQQERIGIYLFVISVSALCQISLGTPVRISSERKPGSLFCAWCTGLPLSLFFHLHFVAGIAPWLQDHGRSCSLPPGTKRYWASGCLCCSW